MKISYKPVYFTAILPPISAWISPRPNAVFQRKSSVLHNSEKDNVFEDLQGGILAEKYVLDEGGTSTSGKSSIFTAYEKDNPDGDPVIIKFSEDNFALYRESVNFDHLDDDLFIEAHEYIEECYFDTQNGVNCEPLENNGALVMEQGSEDLKSYINTHGALKEPELRSIAWTAVQCLRDMHTKGMVWTDLKAQNLVIIPKESPHQEAPTVKGIDVESVIPHKGSVIDYTPRGSPPEFAIHFLCGSEKQMEIPYNFDIWSLGILLHEMATGEHYFEEGEHIEIATELKNTCGLHVNDIPDMQLRDLVNWCLELDPSNRPTIDQVAQHPYFSQTPENAARTGVGESMSSQSTQEEGLAQNTPHNHYSQNPPTNTRDYAPNVPQSEYSQNAPISVDWSMAPQNTPATHYAQSSSQAHSSSSSSHETTSTQHVSWSMAPQNSPQEDLPTLGGLHDGAGSYSGNAFTQTVESTQNNHPENTPTSNGVDWSLAPQNTPDTADNGKPDYSSNEETDIIVNWSLGGGS